MFDIAEHRSPSPSTLWYHIVEALVKKLAKSAQGEVSFSKGALFHFIGKRRDILEGYIRINQISLEELCIGRYSKVMHPHHDYQTLAH